MAKTPPPDPTTDATRKRYDLTGKKLSLITRPEMTVFTRTTTGGLELEVRAPAHPYPLDYVRVRFLSSPDRKTGETCEFEEAVWHAGEPIEELVTMLGRVAIGMSQYPGARARLQTQGGAWNTGEKMQALTRALCRAGFKLKPRTVMGQTVPEGYELPRALWDYICSEIELEVNARLSRLNLAIIADVTDGDGGVPLVCAGCGTTDVMRCHWPSRDPRAEIDGWTCKRCGRFHRVERE